MEVPGRKRLIDQGKASNKDIAIFCHPCDNKCNRVEVKGYCETCQEYLCQTCYDIHTIPTPLQHHVLLGLAQMPKPAYPKNGQDKVSSCTVVCPTHADKVVEFYCLNHNTAVCATCAFRSHKTCQAEEISVIANNYRDSEEYTSLNNELSKLENNVDLSLNKSEENKKSNEASSKIAIKEIGQSKAEAIAYLDRKENELLEKIKEMQSQDKEQILKHETDCQSLKKEIRQVKMNLSKSENVNNDLFIAAQRALIEVKDIKDKVEKCTGENESFGYQFQREKASEAILSSQNPLGKLCRIEKQESKEALNASTTTELTPPIKVPVEKCTSENLSIGSQSQSEKATEAIMSSQNRVEKLGITEKPEVEETTTELKLPLAINIATATVVPMSDICVKQIRKKNCFITGSTLLSPTEFFSADYDNKSVLCVDTTNNSVTSCLQLQSCPCDVTALPKYQAAVTLPWSQQIQIISTRPKVSYIRTIEVNGKCYGIAATTDKLIVSYMYPSKVEVIQLSGEVLQTLKTKYLWANLFKCPEYVTVTNENDKEVIYVSDTGNNTITKLSMDGRVLFSYTDDDLGYPSGVAVTDEGQLLICNRDKHNILLLSPCGEKVSTLLNENHGIKYPRSACYCHVENKIYVSCWGPLEKAEVNNNVKVFKMK